MIEVKSQRTEHGRLLDLRSGTGKMRKQIQNFMHYKDPADGLWKPTEDNVSTGPYDLDGDQFQYRKKGKLTFYAGDLGATGNKTGVAAQITNKPDKWIKMQLRDADSVSWTKYDNHTIRFDNVFAGTTVKLFWRAARRRIEKLIAISDSNNLPPFFEIDYQMPETAIVTAVADGWEINLGGEVYRLNNAFGWSNNNITASKDTSDAQINCTTTLELNSTPGDSYRYLRIRIRPVVTEIMAALSAGKKIMIDPTTTISGTGNIEDAPLLDILAGSNWGIFTPNFAGRTSDGIALGRTVIRITTAGDIPAGKITGFRFIMWRVSDAIETSAGTLNAHAITNANDWGEGAQSGGIASGGECSWITSDSPSAWAGSAGCGTAGTDRDVATMGTLAFGAYTSGIDVQETLTLDTSIATDWRDGNRDNNGFILLGTPEGTNGANFRFNATEAASNQPSFEIDTADASTRFKVILGGI